MSDILRWLRERKRLKLRRRLAGVEARIAQERAYLPTIYPVVMGELVYQRASLQFDLAELDLKLNYRQGLRPD